jgi:hypothetical protein
MEVEVVAETAIADESAELEDGFGTAEARLAPATSMPSLMSHLTAPSMGPLATGQPTFEEGGESRGSPASLSGRYLDAGIGENWRSQVRPGVASELHRAHPLICRGWEAVSTSAEMHSHG